MSSREVNIFDIGHYRNEDGPGIRTIVFFKGCPLRCKWCSNPFGLSAKPQLTYNENKCKKCGACVKACTKGCIQMVDGKLHNDFDKCDACGDCVGVCPAKARNIMGEIKTVDELMVILKKDASFYRRTKGGITLSGGEVLQQYEAATEILKEAHNCLFMTTAIETSAYGPWEHLESMAKYCDTVFVDIKHWDRDEHIKYTGVSNELIFENIKKLCKMSTEKANLKIIIRRLIVEGINDDDETAIEIAKFVNELPGNPAINLLPYHSLGETKYAMIGEDYQLEGLKMMDTKSPRLKKIFELTSQYAPNSKVTIGGGEI